jgi:PEP-CTERM motif
MKKTLLTIALVAATAAAFAQGKVSFGNDSNHYFVLGTTLPADAALGGGTSSTAGNTTAGTTGAIPASPLPSGNSLIAALYAGTSSGNLTLQTQYTLDSNNWLQAGRMVSRGISLSGVPGGSLAYLDVVVATTIGATPGASQAASSAGYFGESGIFTMTPGSSISYPSITTAGGSTWAAANLVINSVPEPTSFALCGLGAAALMIFRRRK